MYLPNISTQIIVSSLVGLVLEFKFIHMSLSALFPLLISRREEICRVWRPEMRRSWGASWQQVATRIESLSSNSEKCNSRRDQDCHVSRLAATRIVLRRHEKRDSFGLP